MRTDMTTRLGFDPRHKIWKLLCEVRPVFYNEQGQSLRPQDEYEYSGTCSYRAELGWVKRSPVFPVRHWSRLCDSTRHWVQRQICLSDERMTAVGERWLAACSGFTAATRNRCSRTTAALKRIDTDEILWESSHPRSNHWWVELHAYLFISLSVLCI
jgi:hypothetical protein